MDNEWLLFDRVEKIKQIINQYGEDNFYISFSGGKDSTILHHLVDMALPDNKIPTVYEEYRRIGYRLKPYKQMKLLDEIR